MIFVKVFVIFGHLFRKFACKIEVLPVVAWLQLIMGVALSAPVIVSTVRLLFSYCDTHSSSSHVVPRQLTKIFSTGNVTVEKFHRQINYKNEMTNIFRTCILHLYNSVNFLIVGGAGERLLSRAA